MPVAAHLEALKQKHAALDRKIHQEESRPAPNEIGIKRLKLEKLHVKEEMDRLGRPLVAAE